MLLSHVYIAALIAFRVLIEPPYALSLSISTFFQTQLMVWHGLHLAV